MSLRVLTALGGSKVGGAEAFFVTLNRALHRAGIDVRAVLRDAPVQTAQLAGAGIPFDIARFGGPFDFFTTPKLARIARQFRPDIALSFAGRATAHMPRGDHVLMARLGGYYSLKRFRRADYLICNTPDLVRYVTEGGWPKDRVFLIPNFPDVQDADVVQRASLDTPEGVPLAVALGRLHVNKGFDVLLRAVAKVPELWLWLAGEGEERNSLERLAAELGVSQRVKFLGWRTDRAGLFKAADLCVFPSRKEPMGNVIVEAWAHGVPVVAAASVGPSWLIRDGEDGLLTPVEDPDAFADGIRKVLRSPELAAQLVANGRRRVADEFSESRLVQHYIDVFERVRRRPGNAA